MPVECHEGHRVVAGRLLSLRFGWQSQCDRQRAIQIPKTRERGDLALPQCVPRRCGQERRYMQSQRGQLQAKHTFSHC